MVYLVYGVYIFSLCKVAGEAACPTTNVTNITDEEAHL